MMVEAPSLWNQTFFYIYIVTTVRLVTKLEVFIIDHLRDFGPSMEKYKVVQNVPV